MGGKLWGEWMEGQMTGDRYGVDGWMDREMSKDRFGVDGWMGG